MIASNSRAPGKTPILAFSKMLAEHALHVVRTPLEVLQVNVGKLCNQACHHCHVEAGPKRTEIMSKQVADRLLELLPTAQQLRCVDFTGGAPELNAQFRPMVRAARARGLEVVDRCNLTVLFEPGQSDTAAFLAEHRVHVVASLPCYSKKNVEKQRGLGVWDKSIAALHQLNQLGYGMPDSGLLLDLVYNPVGAFLPGAQAQLQADYKLRLKHDLNVEFNQLYTITNMPISRFLHALLRDGQFEDYMQLLVQSFNADAALGVMCRNLLSVGYDGQLYDCDFNQMLEMPLGARKQNIFEISSLDALAQQAIYFEQHCYGCTAGAGSSCGGALL